MNRFSYIFAIILSCAWSVSMAQDVTFGLAPGGVQNHFDSRVRSRPKGDDNSCGTPVNLMGVSTVGVSVSLDFYFEENDFSATNSYYTLPPGLEVYVGAMLQPHGSNLGASQADTLVYICEPAIDNLPFQTSVRAGLNWFSIDAILSFQYMPDCRRSGGYFDVSLQLLRKLPSGRFVPYDFSMLPDNVYDLNHIAQSGREHYQVTIPETFCCPDCTIGRRGNVTIDYNGPLTDNKYADGALSIAPTSGNRMEVPRGETVKLTSTKSVTLSPGFSVAKGARFSANYGTCRYSPLMSANESVVPEGQLAVKLQAWPNPFLDALSVKLPPAEDTWNVTLQTMHGQVLASGTGLPEEVLSLQSASLPAGLYLLHASCGKHQLTAKVVKY